MFNPNFMLIYVKDAKRSRHFYAELFNRDPVEESSDFAMFVLESGLKFAMWSREKVLPAPAVEPGGSELVFSVDSDAALDALHREWIGRDLAIAQQPIRLDFGYSFVALDPDGHRLRAYAPAEDTTE
ncbi:drug:proton antiporter [Phyllobacterium sp. SYP-B3895]|uniref:VOC family protein n=1 Tax=Phyllobacterium sp. SYP-B3895 TaxID=2663240 RepID=UPI001299FD20|nr:VOC family protein [Phyllobacterium sp. SYP-B3895]MRG56008.1 drug:proton antiporter [Phyllobacterium sp. SYP-B3895]